MNLTSRRRLLLAVFIVLCASCSGGDSGASKAPTQAAAPAPAATAGGSVAPTEPAAPPEQKAEDFLPSAPASAPAPVSGGRSSGKAAGAPAGRAPAAAPTPHVGSKASQPERAGGPSAGTTSASAPSPVAGGGAKANYASDVGVTAETIRLGTINLTSATRSMGPVIAGLQEQALDTAVKYINRNGGVSGRKLQLVTCDDGGDLARARACYEKLKGNVFAFVPSITWLTDVIHDRLVKDRIPWLSWGWFKSEYENPWMFPCHANGIREARALATWVAKVIRPKTVGLLYLNVSEDIAARDVATRELEAQGVKVVASVSQEWDSPDESQHVLQMRAANPDHVMSFSWPAPVGKFMHDANAQRWAPPKGYSANHLTGDPGYGAVFGDYIKGRLNTITSWAVPAEASPDNADADTPEQRLHAAEMVRTNGTEFQGFKWRYAGMHHITQSGWVCVRILAQAAAALGADLTRDGLRATLESRGWDSGFGVTLHWPPKDHNSLPYSFNREFIYRWVQHPDGGHDLKRVLPDPVFDCAGGNIPKGARTICAG